MSASLDVLALDDLVARPASSDSLPAWAVLVTLPDAAERLRAAGRRRVRIEAQARWIVRVPWVGTAIRMATERQESTGEEPESNDGEEAALAQFGGLLALSEESTMSIRWGDLETVALPERTLISVSAPSDAAIFALAGPDGWRHPRRLQPPFMYRLEREDVPLLIVVAGGDADTVRTGDDLVGRRLGALLVEISSSGKPLGDHT